jgi:formylglycine-generating enzyme required for sulfatase activity
MTVMRLNLALLGSFLCVKSSPFLLGSPLSDPRAELEEQPQRLIHLRSFYIQEHPVTAHAWVQFLSETKYNWQLSDDASRSHAPYAGSDEFTAYRDRLSHEAPVPGSNPIVWVSWHDAQAFIAWYRRAYVSNVTLPSEAQWEKACRGDSGQPYPWTSSEAAGIEAFVEFEVSAYSTYAAQDSLRSAYGCRGMWCGVGEWCLDTFHERFDAYGYEGLPDGSVDPVNREEALTKVIRGGNPLHSGWPRCARRTCQHADWSGPYVGFRLVLSEPERQSCAK